MKWISRLAIIPLVLVSTKAYLDKDWVMMSMWIFLVTGNILFHWLEYKFKVQ